MGLIISKEELKGLVKEWQRKKVKVVLTNGCFDLLHAGHLRTFYEAKKMGDLLIVGINSDYSVRRLKGEQRPLIPQADRAQLVAALKPVDYVTVFDEPTVDTLLETIHPDYYVKGGDYTLDSLPEKETITRLGVRVCFIPVVAGISTTEIIRRIKGLK
ncbi:MAG TPA: D-glycero-beta-D-manno-heptose 1-phosphate adenylyltransferase [Firmicutes bacterium]|nr:D-glycero-beta-D-manno-heptose 1-phosphate adenylyltransferase [Bacillota bacterium]